MPDPDLASIAERVLELDAKATPAPKVAAQVRQGVVSRTEPMELGKGLVTCQWR